MKVAGKFEKVSYEQFKKDFTKGLDIDEERVREIYDGIKLPKRATSGSAGYDFFIPFYVLLHPGETAKFPTGIRVKMNEGFVLSLYPRSSLGFGYRLQLDNTVGIIDSDYYNSDNEGHIHAKITNDCYGDKTVEINAGDAFMQGIFTEYGITEDDNAEGIRNGGIGSTNKKP